MKRRLIVIKKASSGNAPVTPVITISAQPTNQSTSDGNAAFSVTASVTQGATLSYQWQRSTDGGSTFSALSGETSSSLSLSSLTVSSDQYEYRCVVSATGGAASVNSDSATLSVVPTVTISAQPQAQSTSNGSASFSVTASASVGGTLSYQWQRSTDGTNFSNISGETSSSLSLSSLTVSSDQYKYRVSVSADYNAQSVTSNSATLSVVPVVSISVQPSNQSASNGAASFSVTAGASLGGSVTGYQWQVSSDGVNYSNISGATSSTLSLTGLTLNEHDNDYRVVVSGSNGASSVTSQIAVLSVVPVISISSQPSNQTTSDGNASFSVTASANMGGSISSYQWQRSTDGGSSYSNLSGQTSSSLSLSSLTVSSDQYKYRVIVYGNGNAVSQTSNAVTLTVLPVITISAQPQSATTNTTSQSFSVTASASVGGTLSYQWQRSTNSGSTWSNLSGATSSSYSQTSITTSFNSYQYRCVVSANYGASSVNSSAAVLTVQPVITISVQPASQTVTSPSVSFSVTASTSISGNSLTYQWQRSTDSGSSWSNISGATSSSYTDSSVAYSYSGYQYRCVVSQTLATSVNSNAATLTVNSGITINSQPASQTTSTTTATFSVQASITFSGTLSYQWQRRPDSNSSWSNFVGETSSSLSLSGLSVSDSGKQYRCVVSGNQGASSVTSSAATLTVNPVITISVQPSNQTANSTTASFSVTASATLGATLGYQWFVSTDSGATYNAITSLSNASAVTSTLSLTGLALSDNGKKYYCLVYSTSANTSANAQSNAATLSMVPAITISSQPSNQTAILGTSATFSVSASITLSATLSYQWQSSSDGSSWSNISGATSSSYTFTTAMADQSKQYRCVLSGTDGAASVNSNAGILTVQAYTQASVGFANGYALKGGYAWSWGASSGLGSGSTVSVSSPVSMNSVNYVFIGNNSGSGSGGMALDSNSYAFGWGSNSVGQIGNNSTTTFVSTPVSVVGGIRWKQLACNPSQTALPMTAGIDLNGYAFCWGRSNTGAIGNNQTGTVSASSPSSVVGGKQFSFIANGSGSGGVTALDANGYAWSWGAAAGDGTPLARSSPVSVVGGRQFTTVSRAALMAVALDLNSYAYAWGSGITTGALGQNSTLVTSFAPVSVVGGRQWRSIMASVGVSGAYFVVALDSNSYAFAWGSNSLGQLGLNSTVAMASSPTSVVGGIQFNEIYAGHASVIARSGSNYYVWGSNQNGVLGNGSTAVISSPTLVTNIPYAP